MHISISDRLCRICDKLVLLLLCILMADCAVFGAGRTVSVGPLGFRILLLAVIMIAAVPLLIRDFGVLIRNKLLWILGAFAVWLVLEAVLGIVNGNNRSLLAGDIKGFAYFAAVLPVLCVLNSKERVYRLMKVILYASAVLAAAVPVLVFLYNWTPDFFNQMVARDPAHNITMFAAVSFRIPRLFFKSTPYFLCGCAFSVYFALTEKGRKLWWRYPLMAGLSLFALLLSYTRSIYLAVGVATLFLAVVLWLTADRAGKRQLAKTLGASALVCVLLIVLCTAVLRGDFFGYALDRLGVTFSVYEEPTPADPTATDPTETEPDATVPGETDQFQQATLESDRFRALTMAELKKNILRSPIWGHGLGKALEVRNGQANEYIYQDIWMKTGIVGLLLFLAPAVLLVVELIRKVKTEQSAVRLWAPWVAVLLGFLAFSYFNPYMNASLGILFYCCCIGVFAQNKSNTVAK